jgi:hypothetical protein
MVRVVPKGKASNDERRRPAAALGLGVLVLALGGAGCPCLRGPVNASPGLRWWLFSNFGASKICPEMLKRGMALRMQERGPAVGRFFPGQCTIDVDDGREVITVNFAGSGYAYTPLTRRVGFTTTASVEYRPDFYIGEEDMYVWGRMSRIVNSPAFRLGYVENPLADAATAMTPLGTLANAFGNQIAIGELTQGFTVVRNDDRGDDFSLGILMPPQKPHHPFDVTQSEDFTFVNETTEIHVGQMDFLGPFEIAESGQYLAMRYYVEGPSLDAMVVDRATGDLWRDAYQTGRPFGLVPGPILAGAPLPGQTETRVPYRLAPGQYYVVLDHSALVGTVSPPATFIPLSEPLVRVSYVAQLAED